MGRQKTVSRKMFEDARDYFRKYENNKTRQIYTFAYRKFIDYCRKNHYSKTKEDCEKHINDYIDYLKNKGVTASTLHTYLAAICVYHDVSMKNFEKPKRTTSAYRRGRVNNGKMIRSDNTIENPKYTRLVEFQRCVGIRRNELKNLRHNDFVYDESGNACVLVRKGKGGKRQLQRILPDDVEFVKSYFDGTDNNVFAKDELKNKLSLHYLRAKFAQRSYEYYLKLTQNPATKAKLEREVRARWDKYNINQRTGKPKYLPKKLINGNYHLRGKSRQFAVKNNLPTSYNKLALLATSMFSLSHFRNDVTLASYLLVL